MRTLLRGLLLGLLATLALPCKGAEISCVDYVTMRDNEKYCNEAFLHGEIVKGDYNKVALFYTRSYPYLGSMDLQSPGGDVIEAIKIGRLLRKYLITAHAPFHIDDDIKPKLNLDDGVSKLLSGLDESLINLTVISATSYTNLCSGRECVCASSCALIFFGSPNRLGSVGLHRPIIDDPEFKKLSPAEAERAYKPVLALISQYLEEMEVPKALIEAMIATSSSDIHWVGATGKGIDRSPSFAEWQDANCGSGDQAGNEINELHELDVKSKTARLSQAELRLMSLLQEKVDKYGRCIVYLMIDNQKKLPPPTLACDSNDCNVASKNTSRLEFTPNNGAVMATPAVPDRNRKCPPLLARDSGTNSHLPLRPATQTRSPSVTDRLASSRRGVRPKVSAAFCCEEKECTCARAIAYCLGLIWQGFASDAMPHVFPDFAAAVRAPSAGRTRSRSEFDGQMLA